MSEKKTDLVTGGAGFIGSHLVERLLKDGRNVRAVDNLSVGQLSNLAAVKEDPGFQFIEGDIADMSLMDRACEDVDHVYHLAARADIVPSIQEPEAYFRANVDGTFAVLQGARKHKANRLVYVASSSCYGIPDV